MVDVETFQPLPLSSSQDSAYSLRLDVSSRVRFLISSHRCRTLALFRMVFFPVPTSASYATTRYYLIRI